MEDEKLMKWRSEWKHFQQQSGNWEAARIYTDASSYHPKDGMLRVVGWAAVALVKLDGDNCTRWHYVCGTLRPGSTVAQGEARAVEAALERIQDAGVIKTDCWAVYRTWEKTKRSSADDGSALFPFLKVFRAAQARGAGEVAWIPAHCTYEESRRAGMEMIDWEGNGVADSIAKWAAGRGNPEPELVKARRVQRLLNEQAVCATGTVLLQRLKARQRTAEGSAIKVAKRKAPGLPRRLREAKRPRRLVAGVQVQGLQLGDLLLGGAVEPICGKCGLKCANGRHLAASDQHCPVPDCTRGGRSGLKAKQVCGWKLASCTP